MKSRWSENQQVALLALLLLMIIEVPISMSSNPVQSVNQVTSVTGLKTSKNTDEKFATAADEVYTENFTSTTYRDATNTNASGWGTGNLSLSHKNPFLAASLDTPGYANGVYVDDDYVYVAAGTSGLKVVNITDPTHPSPAGEYTPSFGGVNGVYVSGDYAYVSVQGFGLQVIEVQRNLCREYASSSMAQSLAINQGYSLTHATLQVTETQALNTSTAYYLSADNGLHWEPVTPGVQHDFANSGTQLCWRAVFSTTVWDQTPVLSSLSIAYSVRLDAPSLTSPSNGQYVGDNTPLLQWSDAYVGLRYLVQVDTVTSFDSINLVNITVPVGWKNCTTPILTDGLWYWRVAVNDTDGVLSLFSSPWSMTIDTTGPTWDQTPTNKVVEPRTPFRYDLNASASTGINKWWINDTVHFAIDGSGVITNTTTLAVGVYGIQVSVNDTYNNVLSGEFSVTVLKQQTTTTTTTTTTTSTTTTTTTSTTTTITTTPTTSASPNLGTMALILGGLSVVVILVIIEVFMKRRPS